MPPLLAVISTHISPHDWLAIGISSRAIPDYERIKELTFRTASAEDRLRTRETWKWTDVAASAGVMVFIPGAYLYFRG